MGRPTRLSFVHLQKTRVTAVRQRLEECFESKRYSLTFNPARLIKHLR